VEANECRLRNGELAFVYVAGPTPPLPDRFEAPAGSTLRQSPDWPRVFRSKPNIRGSHLRYNRGEVRRAKAKHKDADDPCANRPQAEEIGRGHFL
jgi:hypothetical protein